MIGRQLWVSLGWESLNSNLKGFYKRSIKKRYQPIYIEFIGESHSEESDGLKSAYDGAVHISKITKLEAELPNDCK